MAFTYTTRNGKRVEVNVAAAFDRMADAFARDTGYQLLIRSGTRTAQEQINIFKARYVPSNQVGGRRVYDYRRWNGTLWARISSAGTVAVPGTSNHEESGPNGPRSIDIYDSGPNAGVASRGTARDRWMQAHAEEYGFSNEGYNFGEPWHKTYRGKIGGSGGGTSGGGSSSSISKENNMDVMILINGKIYALAPGFIKHCDSTAQVTEAKGRGVPQIDYTGGDRLNQWVRALDFYGIPRDVLDRNGLVINPESGKAQVGGLWSWERANRALLTKLVNRK